MRNNADDYPSPNKDRPLGSEGTWTIRRQGTPQTSPLLHPTLSSSKPTTLESNQKEFVILATRIESSTCCFEHTDLTLSCVFESCVWWHRAAAFRYVYQRSSCMAHCEVPPRGSWMPVIRVVAMPAEPWVLGGY